MSNGTKQEEETQEEKEKKAAKGPAGILSSVLGFAAPIAGMIPSLRKSGQRGQLEAMQRGQGAGASMARQTGSEAARRVVGSTGARGGEGALREGFRAADEIVQRGAQQAAITGARESLAATQMLRQEERERRGAARVLGAGVGQGLSGIAATLVAGQDQGPVKPETGYEVDYTGYPATSPGATFEPRVGGVEAALGTGGVITQPPVAPTVAPGAETQGPGPGVRDQFGIAPGTALEPTTAAPAGPLATSTFAQQLAQPTQRLSEVAQAKSPEAKLQRGLQDLAQVTAEKQVMNQIYASTTDVAGGAGVAPPIEAPVGALDPIRLADYLYGLADNYNPMLNQGMHPQEVAILLERWQLPVDYVRLGLVDPTQETAPGTSPHGQLEQKATSGARAAGETIRGMVTGNEGSQ